MYLKKHRHGLYKNFVGLAFLSGVLSPMTYGQHSKQLHHLPKPSGPRFEITDRIWPETLGEGHICLWKDDKLCSVSFTIDDNSAPDHTWWIEQGAKYGFNFTWFIITERVGSGDHWGTWEGFSALQRLGHEVQSHSVTHLGALGDGAGHDPRVKTIDDEYRLSIEDIENNIPGPSCHMFAYPNGPKPPNERAVAERYFIGARGVAGHLNKVNQIDYLETNSLGNGINMSTEQSAWCQFRTLLDPSLRGGQNYRGWNCTHFHQVKEDKRAGVIEQFEYLKEREADVWVGLFGEVIRYGQERDTAKLKRLNYPGPNFKFSLSDDMDDSLFAYPLTIKVRVPDAWTSVRAAQGKQEIPVSLINHSGHVFALMQAVPDRGEILLGEK